MPIGILQVEVNPSAVKVVEEKQAKTTKEVLNSEGEICAPEDAKVNDASAPTPLLATAPPSPQHEPSPQYTPFDMHINPVSHLGLGLNVGLDHVGNTRFFKYLRVIPDENGMIDYEAIIDKAEKAGYFIDHIGDAFIDYIGEIPIMTADSEQVEIGPPPSYNEIGTGIELVSDSLTKRLQGTKECMKARIKLRKCTPEEKAILQQEYDQVSKMQVAMLTPKLIERLRPYVEAKHPGKKDDPETIAFVNDIRREAEKLRTEHFGVELLCRIGEVYSMKATAFVRSRASLIQRFTSQLKEWGAVIKYLCIDIRFLFRARISVKRLRKLEAKGELGEGELQALKKDVASQVVDNVLKESDQSDTVLYNRAKKQALLLIASIFKPTVTQSHGL
ncbi:X-domain of DnaJ-containing domain containing protein [Amanita muscaria]